MKKFAAALAVSFLSLNLVHADNTGLSFLSFSPDARAEGMGGAFTAVADDASALYWNPAGMAFFTRAEFIASYENRFSDTKTYYLGFAAPTPAGSFGGVFQSLGQDDLEGRAADRSATGSFSAGDVMAQASYARALGPFLGAGVSGKWVRETIGSHSAQGPAFDLGLLADTGLPGLRAGAALRHWGPSLKFDAASFQLPTSFSGGAAYGFGRRREHAFSVDYLQHMNENRSFLALGAEVFPHKIFALRVGYRENIAGKETTAEQNRFAGFSAGFGLWFNKTQIDYSFAPAPDEELGLIQKLTLRLRL